jgi:hypothetical protein
VYYAIHAVRNVSMADGWTATRQLPTFYLHDVPQGILNVQAAERTARDLLESASEGVPGKVVFSVTAFPVDSDIT